MAVLGVWQTTRQGRVLTRYALPFLAVSLFGVRPAELSRLVLESDGQSIRATVRGAKVNEQRGRKPAPNNSSKRLPNHASNTSSSASVIGTASGQSSVTVHASTSCLGGRPMRGQGSGSM